jgi:hypothetical protein
MHLEKKKFVHMLLYYTKLPYGYGRVLKERYTQPAGHF